MSFQNLFNMVPRKYLLRSHSIFPGLSENDILFFKRDVCVHPISGSRQSDHNSGVLIIQKQNNKKSLLIAWIPNEIFDKHTRTQPQNLDSRIKKCDGSMSSWNCDMIFVDTDILRSVKIIYDNKRLSCGQCVIMSLDGFYRTFHFHKGGLENLADAFNMNVHQQKKQINEMMKKDYYFSTVCSFHPRHSFHPDEGKFKSVSLRVWCECIDNKGSVLRGERLEKAVFFSGIDECMRSEVWPFLLGCYGYNTTREERRRTIISNRIHYDNMKKTRASLSEQDYVKYLANYDTIIQKDAVRTDRNHPFYSGENNPNIETMINILETYAIYHPRTGYIQGMSDILAPLLAEMHDEADAYWCFEGAMKHTIFYVTSKSVNLDKEMLQILELSKLLLPEVQKYAAGLSEGGNIWMNFCHRWLLVCFKRDFHYPDFLKIWEACWTQRETSDFKLFVCLAILSLYGGDAFEQKMDVDDLLMHFNSLSMNMNVNAVMRRARSLLHKFKMTTVVPCTLFNLLNNGNHFVNNKAIVECSHTSTKDCPL